MTPHPFQAHIELFQFFLAHRSDIVERIQGHLNAQRKPIDYLQNGPLLFRHFEDCFFGLPGIAPGQLRLRGQLEEEHWASGFRPREIPGLHNGLIDPAEMMIRGFHLWQQTRWPGRSLRVRYAQTLFNLYLVRCLELLSMRLWDDGAAWAGERLAQVQAVLDQLWKTSPADQPVLVRDARWLIQLAQSPATDDLGAYFDVAEKVADTLSDEDRLEIHKAGVRMAGGHLRSQIRYYALKKAVPLHDKSVTLSTRNSNALDFALLIQELVPLLAAYEHACLAAVGPARLALAGAICQGISPDPELFVNRIELLGPYSMLEHLFVTTDPGGHAAYTPMGRRHVRLLDEYDARIGRIANQLHEDCGQFRPIAGTCSPYGVLYGFSSDLIEHMALKTMDPGAVTRFGLEDVFADGDTSPDKLAWVNGWRKLPHITPDVLRRFDYPQQFADEIFERIEQALRTRASTDDAKGDAPIGRIFVESGDAVPDLPVRYILSSDRELVAAQKAVYRDEQLLLTDLREGKYLLSYRTPRGWAAITKDVLTEVLGEGRNVKSADLPPAAMEALRLMSGRSLS